MKTQAVPASPQSASPARTAALEILCRVDEDDAYADLALEAHLGEVQLAPRDRALATELVYGTLRWRRLLDWELQLWSRRPLGELEAWVLNLLRLSAYQLRFLDRVPPWAAVDDAVRIGQSRGHKGIGDYVNGLLRRVARTSRDSLPELDDPIESLAVRNSFPSWLVRRWIPRYGFKETEDLANAMNQRPPTTVRVNSLRVTRDGLAARLATNEKIASRPTPFAPDGLVLEDSPPLMLLDAFQEGLLSAQDEASVLISHLVDPKPGEIVADVCSAPGTKTTHLAQLMTNEGRLIAMDPHPGRLKLVSEACHRLGIEMVECHAGRVEALASTFKEICDRVLVDAPCSNLGVVRRHPDVKWRRSEADLESLPTLQQSILAAAATLVRPGGLLVYATCSLEPEENEAVVTRFLAQHPGFSLEPPKRFLVPFEPSGFLRLTPSRHGTDGFSAARLRRRSS